MSSELTISQAAAFAGVTIKTVRHYHRLGLVGEPIRDSSGYRRYGSAELLRLVQVRTLAEAGVPLAEVGAMLDADPETFAADVADVKARLTERIAELAERRDMLDRLATGNRLLLSDHAARLLDRIAALGFPEGFVDTSRDGLILAKALLPDFEGYLAQVERSLDDEEYTDLLKRSWEASAWEPYDPRVAELAEAMADYQLSHPDVPGIANTMQGAADSAARSGVIDDYKGEIAPAVARLSALVEARLRRAGGGAGPA
ncbi:MerR family transcriptional regulator [Phytomonospora sp. NPDC050363]|uniref:MerR family transcriptional regulator n=1 Tax=Phytomonospora sp. NPDC050363 TaxID=3155642 RepID=UPI0033E35984